MDGKSVIFALMKRLMFILLMFVPLITGAQNTMSVLNHLHQVNKGETLYGIARQYNITEQELLSANPEIGTKKKLKKGTYLTIPQPQAVQQDKTVANEETVRKKRSVLKVGVVLPFAEKSERAKKMVEFYQGFLMAADSAKKEGLSMEIHAYSSGRTEADIMEVLGKPGMSRLDILFGPVDEQQLPATINFCKLYNIRVVLPFDNGQSTAGNPNLYLATPRNSATIAEAAAFIAKTYADRIYVILKTGNEDSQGSIFTRTLSDMLSMKGNQTGVLNINSDDYTYEDAMNQFRENVIVPDNTSLKTLNIIISKLNTFRQKHPQYNISLLGYPEWQTYTNTLLNSLFTYDTYIYSPYYYNALAASTRDFENAFLRNFRRPMAKNYPRYAMMGFDLGLYFIHEMMENGPIGHRPQIPQQNMYRFIQEAENSGYTNNFIQLIHYTKTKQIELIR